MSVEISLIYSGELRCKLTHGPSQAELETDAPKDNMGKGEAFAPTDLLAASLLACAVTTMAIKGGLSNGSGRVTKHMSVEPPRRVEKLTLEFSLSAPDDQHAKLEDIARKCPVALSLSTEVDIDMRFRWID